MTRDLADPAASDPADTPESAGTGERARPASELHYDMQELRRCLTLGFSAGELNDLASAYGVAPSPGSLSGASRPADEAARLLLKAAQQQGRVGALVSQLQEDRPLVHWPAPRSAPAGRPTAVGQPELAPDDPVAPAAATQGSEPEGLLDVQRSAPMPVEPGPSTGADVAPDESSAPPQAEPAVGMEATEPEGGESAASTPMSAGPASAVPTPAIADRSASSSPRLRWIVAGAGGAVLLLAMIVAFFAGRATSSGESGDDAAPAEPTPTEQPPLAQAAATELTRAVTAVAEACGLSETRGPAKQVLAQAFRQCAGPSGGRRRPEDIAPGLPSALTTTTQPPTAAKRAPAAPPAARDPRPAGGSRCLDHCADGHRQCKKSKCGAEPTSGSDYAEYQRCLTECLSKASQCRLRCG